MAGYIGSKAVLLSTTAAVVTGDMTVAGATTLSGAFTSLGIDDNATSTAITIDASENVGIGTSSPDRPVHLSSSGSRNYVKAETTGATNASESGFEIKTPSSNWLINSLGGSDALTFYDLGNTSERMRIDASGNVGIGTSSPTANTNRSTLALAGTWGGQVDIDVSGVNHAQFGTDNFGSGQSARVQSKDGIVFRVNGGTEKVRIDSSGNVGIGVAPSSALHLGDGAVNDAAEKTTEIVVTSSDPSWVGAGAGMKVVRTWLSTSWLKFMVSSGGGRSTAMTIDASGNVLVGKTVNDNTTVGTVVRATGQLSVVNDGFETGIFNRLTSDGANLKFQKDSVLVGSISVTGSATAYNTSSDYRLKENVTPIQGAADTVMAMQPCTYTAIVDGVWYDGFLAHELQEVHPRAVTGTKDAMQDEEYEVTPAVYEDVVTPAVDAVAATYDDEGIELTPAVEAAPETTESALVTEAVMGTRSVPDMQSVDYSKITPILTAALQEALTEIAALKVRVAALEVTP